jgi:hypothetical protein
MKTITLNIDDEVFDELKSDVIGKQVTGNNFGLSYEFMKLIVKSIEDGKVEKSIVLKKHEVKG